MMVTFSVIQIIESFGMMWHLHLIDSKIIQHLIDQNVYSVENRVVKETDLSYFTEFGENVGQSYDTEKNNGEYKQEDCQFRISN